MAPLTASQRGARMTGAAVCVLLALSLSYSTSGDPKPPPREVRPPRPPAGTTNAPVALPPRTVVPQRPRQTSRPATTFIAATAAVGATTEAATTAAGPVEGADAVLSATAVTTQAAVTTESAPEADAATTAVPQPPADRAEAARSATATTTVPQEDEGAATAADTEKQHANGTTHAATLPVDVLIGMASDTNASWTATPPPRTELCEVRRLRQFMPENALVVMLGPVASGRTLENAIRNVAAPLCAWTVLVDVVDDARKCKRQGMRPTPAGVDDIFARVAAEVEPKSLRESLGPKLEALGSARHLISEDRRECGHIDHPPPPLPLRHFGWEVHHGPCVELTFPTLPQDDGVVTHIFRGRRPGRWFVGDDERSEGRGPFDGLSELIRRVREVTFGSADGDDDETAVVDVRGAADFAVVGGLTDEERDAARNFDGAQLNAAPAMNRDDPTVLSLKQRFPVDPPMPFIPQNSIEDRGLPDPHPHELIRGTSLNIADRPIPRLASSPYPGHASVLRKACPSPTRDFCGGDAFGACVRRARWLAQVLITLDEQDSFGDRVAFADRDPSWTPTSGDDDAPLSFPPPRKRFRPLPRAAPSSSRPSPRCAAMPALSASDPSRRSVALLYTGQLRTGRTALAASLKQLAGNSLTAFLAIGVPDLGVAREQLQFFHQSADVPLAGVALLNGTRAIDVRWDRAEFPHPKSWKTLSLLETRSIASQHFQLLTVSTMMYLYEQRCDVRFDFIVRTRPDSLYRWPLPPSALPRLHPGVLVVDGGWDYENGLSDQFAFGPAWLIGGFIGITTLYPQILNTGVLPFTQQEMIHRFSLELLQFPFARLVRTSRRETFLLRPDHIFVSAMHRGVLASQGVPLPPACKPPEPWTIDAQLITFVEDAAPCEGRSGRPAPPIPPPAPAVPETPEPSKQPEAEPSKQSEAEPSKQPEAEPSKQSEAEPSKQPEAEPSKQSEAEPTLEPMPAAP